MQLNFLRPHTQRDRKSIRQAKTKKDIEIQSNMYLIRDSEEKFRNRERCNIWRDKY